MHNKFHWSMGEELLYRWPCTATDWPEKLQRLWRYSRTVWIKACAMCSGLTLLEKWVWTRWPAVVSTSPTHFVTLLHPEIVPYLSGPTLLLPWSLFQVNSFSWLCLLAQKQTLVKESNDRDIRYFYCCFCLSSLSASDTSLVLYLLSFHKSFLL